ncbi:Rossmann-like and DUF2520 domain-containing protein [Corynebacterium heidelbergense]|uniref:DUF2520 domain-containing protein n=1 Tax=Corynebacterium heidelbergense TaxID=2055947 RepID=A0A364VEG7_9CORY|nr:DUF2520 domain-containing protein [Corynebacterium heidelbergense]RAV34956.1 DUF2520 domain-containing protein [Corynebacterium heidelbergense]WCZ35877.1 Rossmann-like domain protein [Corynebacterium heidelbergense]
MEPVAPSPRLQVGIISAGRVGVALAEVFAASGHRVSGIVAPSERSRRRAEHRVPEVPCVDVATAARAQLVVLAVPDPHLGGVAQQVAEYTHDGQMVMHTSGRFGCAALQPVTDTGALPLALHPAMMFTDAPRDSANLDGCAWGVTADSEIGQVAAEVLIHSLHGRPVTIPEDRRAAYHAVLAHAANHTTALLADAATMMDAVLASDGVDGAGGNSWAFQPQTAALLQQITQEAAHTGVTSRLAGLTGPIIRDDANAVRGHLAALEELGVSTDFYRSAAIPTARQVGAADVLRVLLDPDR